MGKTSIAVVRTASAVAKPTSVRSLLGRANCDCFDPPGVRLWGSPICVGAACRTKPWSAKRGLAVCLERRVHLANGTYPDRI